MRKKILLAAAAVVAVGTTAAAISTGPGRAPRPQQSRTVVADSLAALPADSLSDWTTYSDYVVDAVATRVERTQPSAEEVAAGEGLSVRLVTLKVTDVVWKAPAAHPQPAALVIPDGGWLFAKGRPERQLLSGDSVSLEVGHHYLIPIFYDETFKPAWQGLQASAILPFDNGVAGQGGQIIGPDQQPVTALKAAADPRESRRGLWGKGATAIASSLAAAKPDAHADTSLPPTARYQKALRQR